jgi:hypothetical protein
MPARRNEGQLRAWIRIRKFCVKAASALVSVAFAATACSAEQVPEPQRVQPRIPTALHGCWELRAPPDDEFSDGLSETMTVKADRIIIDAKGVDRRIGTVEKVEELGPKLMDGLISAKEDNQLVTLATRLELDPEGAPPGTLLLREGDAGSYHFSRCAPGTAASQRFSLVIAETGRQNDPKPAPCGPNGRCGDFLYRADFHHARVIAGAELPEAFDARLTLHTPYISSYVLALIVERQKDGSLLVRRQAGFNGRNGVACFNDADEWPVDWNPEQVAAVRYDRGDLCVFDKDRIDPHAPKE